MRSDPDLRVAMKSETGKMRWYVWRARPCGTRTLSTCSALPAWTSEIWKSSASIAVFRTRHGYTGPIYMRSSIIAVGGGGKCLPFPPRTGSFPVTPVGPFVLHRDGVDPSRCTNACTPRRGGSPLLGPGPGGGVLSPPLSEYVPCDEEVIVRVLSASAIVSPDHSHAPSSCISILE